MNYYEKIVILNPNIDDSAVEDTVQKIKDIIAKQGGEIFKTENWGRRKLAYELNKHSKGNYILLLFKAPPTTILEIEKMCKIVDSIIKFMVVKLTHKKQIEAVTAAKTEAVEPAAEAAPAEEKASGAEAGSAQPEEK